MLKNYFKRKSKLGIAIDVFVVILGILLIVPVSRKQVLPLILRPTLFIHQPSPVNKPIELTDRALQWKLQDASGVVHKIEDFKGEVVFINMWATWCPPCVAELPQLNQLHRDFGDKVRFIFISNEKSAVVNDFLSSKGYSLPTYMPLSNYPAQFDVQSIPTTYILNKKGEMVLAKQGAANWNGSKTRIFLEALLAQ